MIVCLLKKNKNIWKSQVVLSCIENSPAARAGIHQGDELVEINGTDQVSYSKIFNLKTVM